MRKCSSGSINPGCSTYSWAACVKNNEAVCGTLLSGPGGCVVSQGYCNSPAPGSPLVYQLDPGTTPGTVVGIQLHDGSFKDQGTSVCSITVPNPPPTDPDGCFAGSGGPNSCQEKSLGEATPPKFAENVLTTYGCIANPSGSITYTVNLPGGGTASVTANLFTLMKTTPYTLLSDYFAANTALGAVAAVTCYTDTTYTTVSNYLLFQRAQTPTDNYACLQCKTYQVFTVGAACRCISGETAWAIPLAPIMANLQQGTGENVLPWPYPPTVTWTARADSTKANAWGGYFRITPAPHDTSVSYFFDVCAGCGLNRVEKGAVVAQLEFRITDVNGKTSITKYLKPTSGVAKVNSSVLHMYQSFVAPPTLTPGQFQRFTDTTFTLPITEGSSWTVTRVITGAIKIGQNTTNVPANEVTGDYTNPKAGLFVAIHFSVSGSYCAGSTPIP
ncbi:hypothetical protein HYH02_002536 [Chlamydomonas schloesseri]|uniref:Uncharacterized protein n=1 Tax=Chlamydomonas schloesseri TaxID=2026947 RepID=A0A835WTW8_9CHLO|nr:hypothetical protein HYH02_002536 [Chlamydomonas schloesseri]|eukprot:KAG2453213.1 hypothetical protein HYH02_002536 [Chlamydomonas schloesseri]